MIVALEALSQADWINRATAADVKLARSWWAWGEPSYASVRNAAFFLVRATRVGGDESGREENVIRLAYRRRLTPSQESFSAQRAEEDV